MRLYFGAAQLTINKMHEIKDGKQMVSGALRKCGCPIRDPDGIKRRTVTGSVSGATWAQMEVWRAKAHEARPITRMGELMDHLADWAKANGYDPTK